MKFAEKMVNKQKERYMELQRKLEFKSISNKEEKNSVGSDILYDNLDLQENLLLNKMLDCKERWTNGDKLKQKEFMETYINITCLKYISNDFYNINGYLGLDKLKQSIFNILNEANVRNLNVEIKSMVELLRMKCFSDNVNLSTNKVYVKNGLITLNKNKHSFQPVREFTIHLMNVNYTTSRKTPKKWLNFLNSLLSPEDIDILQEYLGYCLIPSTDAQKSLFIIGKGGEGKSVIGKVLNSIFGSSLVNIKIQKLLTNKFSLAQLNSKLVIFEDELQDIPLREIDTFKSLITGGQFSIEEKYQREQQVSLYARFIVLGNNILKHKNCKEPSFQRRLLLLITKEKDKNRIDNPYLSNELIKEKDLIFMWMLKGLERLLKNNYRFSHQDYMKERIENYYKSDYSKVVELFINDDRYIKLLSGSCTTTNDLMAQFKKYCSDNYIEYNGDKFSKELPLLQEAYNIKKEKIYFRELNKQLWGYRNITLAN